MESSTPLAVTAFAPDGLQTSASELVCAVENGDEEEMRARIRNLSQREFIAVLKAIQVVDSALAEYAISWKHSEYWGRGTPYPDEA